MARVNMGASLPAINRTNAVGDAAATLNGGAPKLTVVNIAKSGKKPPGWSALRALHKDHNLPKRPPTALEKALAPVKRLLGKVSTVVNTLAVQFVLYCVYVLFFQALIAAVRVKEEVYLTKYLLDNIIEEPISTDGDADNHRQFMSIANLEDADMFIEHVLMPALVVDGRLDGEFKTPVELAETMDNLDWSAGMIIKQSRVAEFPAADCGTYETGAMLRWFVKDQLGACPHANQLWGADRPLLEECPLSQPHRYSACYPELSSLGSKVDHLVDKSDFGFNWTHPDEPLGGRHAPWRFFTADELGSDPSGQASASTTSSYNTLPNGGFVVVFIPFFSGTELPTEHADSPAGVLDFRPFAYNVSRGATDPKFFCMRLSWNGHQIEQFCDPNDENGRTTGLVLERMAQTWTDMKAAQFIDYKTRIISMTVPIRANHAMVKNRLTMMLQLTSLGGVLPSFELQSRVDIIDYEWVFSVLYMNGLLVVFFIINEGIEAYIDGFGNYFTNMWNLMDWSGFLLFFALFVEFHRLRYSLTDTTCNKGAYMCTMVGYHDDWEQFYYTKQAKFFLSLCSTLQMLKVIKFINVFVPKMALATSVLSHGLGDLSMFTFFFLFSIYAFAQMFYIQLGPYLDSYNDMISSFFSLFRALFGDFDIALIMDNSSDYINAILLILYLFAAIFVLLSIFLTILGEHQGQVRDEEKEAKEAGTRAPDYGIFSFLAAGLSGEVNGCMGHIKAKFVPPEPGMGDIRRRMASRQNWGSVLDMIGASSGGTGGPAPRKAAEGGLDHALGLGANTELTEADLALVAKGGAPGGGGGKEVAALHSLVTQQQKMLEQLLKEQRELKATVLQHKKSVDQQGASVPRLGANSNLGSVSGGSEASRATSPAVLRIEMPQQNRDSRHGSGGGHRSRGGSSRHHSHHGQSEPGVQRATSMERRGRPHRGSQMGHSMGFLHSAQNGTTASAGTSLSSDAGSLPPTPQPPTTTSSAGWSRSAASPKHLSHV